MPKIITNNVVELNPCNSTQWLAEFKTLPTYHRVTELYDYVISSYQEMSLLRAAWHHTVYDGPRDFCELYQVLDCTPFYYIEKVMQNNPAVVADLGCGLNVFKKIYPNIVGIDTHAEVKPDVVDFFDECFSQGHRHHYDGVISINTIHFSPIDTITQRLLMVNNIVKPGRRAFVSFNLETWLMYSEKQLIDELFGTLPKLEDVFNYVNNQIINTKLDFEVVDWPVLRISEHSSIRDDYNGNIRLVFRCD